ncbi:fibronectin type III domain-containing protein [Paenibacillus sp. 1001270B_150601_E10]|uniref:RCC1 domain-containing protein n=1 Tax=Paenibacillus sp. 1001270B_150601_E10 TaxID=2787079 RepID=UPI0018A0A88D|nr:hypothetical protein [Paenibacillus sp. 1001270B_150601_E10]
MKNEESVHDIFFVIICTSLLGTSVSAGSTFYYYDLSNRLISKTVTNKEGNKNTTEYTYDENGNLLRKKHVKSLNNLTNGDYENFTGTNGIADHWKAYNLGTSAQSFSPTTDAYSGKQAQHIQLTNAAEGAVAGIEQQISIAGGKPFVLGGNIRIIQLSDSIVQFGIRFYDVNHQLIQDEFRQLTSSNDRYSFIMSRGIVPPNAVSANVYVFIRSSGNQGQSTISIDTVNLDYSQMGSFISLGDSHVLAIKNNQSVWGWGHDFDGRVPDNNDTPVPFIGLENVRSVAAADHSSFLLQDGTVWGVGSNTKGQLGNGTNKSSRVPVQALGLDKVIKIDSGFSFVLALKEDGTVWSWGLNHLGQLGDGTTIDKNIPVQAIGLTNVVDIAAGEMHNIALKSDGTVWSWGTGGSGQLGTGKSGAYYNESAPVQVIDLQNIKAIGAGDDHSFAISSDGALWAWGMNSYGRLGDGTTTSRNKPVNITGISNVVAVTGGKGHTIALSAEGNVWSWGRNYNGQLGLGNNIDMLTPVLVPGLNGITEISAADDSSLVLRLDGTVFGWGNNFFGVLGSETGDSPTPVPVFSRGEDVIPPNSPSGFSATPISDRSFHLTWTASDDNAGVMLYEIYNQGIKIASTRMLELELKNMIPYTKYSLSVVAVDLSGNRSDPSGLVEITTSQDSEPPSAPSNLTQSNLTSTTVQLV